MQERVTNPLVRTSAWEANEDTVASPLTATSLQRQLFFCPSGQIEQKKSAVRAKLFVANLPSIQLIFFAVIAAVDVKHYTIIYIFLELTAISMY